MRRFLILILLLTSTVSLRAASYEARSQQHAFTLDVMPMGAVDVRYDVKISDVVTGELLAFSQLTARRGMPAEPETNVRDMQIRIRVSEGTKLTAPVAIVHAAN